MDEDLSQMTREELIGEIKSYVRESERIATAAGTSFVGIILRYGVCCQKERIQSRWCRNGRNSSEAV